MNFFPQFLCVPAVFYFLACGQPLRAEERPLRVVTLNTVLGEIAREVGGDRAVVSDLVRAGVDPHTFEPSAADMKAVVKADVVIASGLNMESYLNQMMSAAETQGHLLVVGDALPLVLSLPGGEKDPHWWHSIDDVIFAAGIVRAEFSRLRPDWSEIFARNAKAYQQRLLALKVWTIGEIAKLPPGQRQLVTSHDAFGYFARDYGFAVHPISGISTEAEADAKHLARVIDLIRSEHIRAIFAESTVNPQLVANLVSETHVRLGGTLYADGLGPADSDAATYEAMYRHNVRTIVKALSAP